MTHLRKRLASGFRLVKMRLYSPDSLTVSSSAGRQSYQILVVPPSRRRRVGRRPCSGSPMSRMSHTSLATNHGSPSFMTARTGLSSNLNSVGKSCRLCALRHLFGWHNLFLFRGLARHGYETARRAAGPSAGLDREPFPDRPSSVTGDGANKYGNICASFALRRWTPSARGSRAPRKRTCTNGALVRMSVFCCF